MLNEKMTQTSPKASVALLGAIFVIAGMAVYNWTVSPQTTYLHAARQYEKIANDAKQRTLILEKTIALKQQECSVSQIERDELKTKFFSPSEAGDFLADIELMIAEAGCDVDSRRLMPVTVLEDEKGLSTVNISRRELAVKFTGSYSGISGLIEELASGTKRVVISGLDLEVTSDFSALVCDVNITIYVLEDKEINRDV